MASIAGSGRRPNSSSEVVERLLALLLLEVDAVEMVEPDGEVGVGTRECFEEDGVGRWPFLLVVEVSLRGVDLTVGSLSWTVGRA